MSLLHEIRHQPPHIRKLMFGLSIITTVSLVGMIWFQSFQSNMYALLNPETINPEDQRYYAVVDEKTKSPFALMKGAFKDVSASIFGIFGEDSGDTAPARPTPGSSVRALPLPLSEPK